MKVEELYRGMADWFRTHKFTPAYGDGRTCGCFIHAARDLAGTRFLCSWDLPILLDIIGGKDFEDETLYVRGWTGPECTDDAIAACEIAADLAS